MCLAAALAHSFNSLEKTMTIPTNRRPLPCLLIALSALALLGACDRRQPAVPDGGATAPTTPMPTPPTTTTPAPAPMAPASSASQ